MLCVCVSVCLIKMCLRPCLMMMDESRFESESESLSPCCLSVGPIHPKLWEHWAWAGLGLGLLLLCFLLWLPLQVWFMLRWPLPCPSPSSSSSASASLSCIYLLVDGLHRDSTQKYPSCCVRASSGTPTHLCISVEIYGVMLASCQLVSEAGGAQVPKVNGIQSVHYYMPITEYPGCTVELGSCQSMPDA